jgi:hypothetical protein
MTTKKSLRADQSQGYLLSFSLLLSGWLQQSVSYQVTTLIAVPRSRNSQNSLFAIPITRRCERKLQIKVDFFFRSSAGQEFPAYYGTRRFITSFARARHWALSRARWIHLTLSHPTTVNYLLSGGGLTGLLINCGNKIIHNKNWCCLGFVLIFEKRRAQLKNSQH